MAANHRNGAQERADGRREATFADLLVRVDALGVSDVEIERAAGLPAAFLAKARAGKNRGDRATASWAKLAAWLAAQGGQAAKGLSVAPAPTQSMGAPIATEASSGLLAAIKAAKTYDSLGGLIEHIMLGVADGSIEKGVGAVLIEAAREQRQLVKGAEHEKAMRTLATNARHLSSQEAQWITDMRAAKSPPALTPDQAVPPPSSVG